MGLSIDGHPADLSDASGGTTLTRRLCQLPAMRQMAQEYRQHPIMEFHSPVRSLYVTQGSVACVSLSEESPALIGSDDATSCIHVCFCSRERVLFTHADFPRRLPALMSQVHRFLIQSSGGPAPPTVDVWIAGSLPGYEEVPDALLDLLRSSDSRDVNFNLKLLFVGDFNCKLGTNLPFCFGAVFDCEQRKLLPAHFKLPARNPVGALRQVMLHFTDSQDVHVAFQHDTNQLVVPAFGHWQLEAFLSQKRSREQLNQGSTTPDHEPEEYYATCEACQLMFSRLMPLRATVFANKDALRFKFSRENGWIAVNGEAPEDCSF